MNDGASPSPAEPLQPWSLVTLAALFSASLGLVAAITDYASERVNLAEAFTLPSEAYATAGVGLVAGAAVGGAMVLLIGLVPSFRTIASRLLPVAAWERFGVLELVLLSAAAAVGEEVLFRGAIQPFAGLWVQAVLFGVLHWSTPTHALLATAAGLGLGYLYQASGSLWPPILAHFAVDLVTGLAAREALRRGWRP